MGGIKTSSPIEGYEFTDTRSIGDYDYNLYVNLDGIVLIQRVHKTSNEIRYATDKVVNTTEYTGVYNTVDSAYSYNLLFQVIS